MGKFDIKIAIWTQFRVGRTCFARKYVIASLVIGPDPNYPKVSVIMTEMDICDQKG